MKKIKSILNVCILSSLMVPTTLLVASCKNSNQTLNITLVSDTEDGFKFSKTPTLHYGKESSVQIVQKMGTISNMICNIHIWSPNGWLVENEDFSTEYNEDRTIANLKIFAPESDLFVVLSSSNSGHIVSLHEKPVDIYPRSNKNRELLFKYKDIVEPDKGSVKCKIAKVTCSLEQFPAEIFSVSDIQYDEGFGLIHFKFGPKYKLIPAVTQEMSALFEFTYTIFNGVPISRFVEIPFNYHDDEYVPVTYTNPTTPPQAYVEDQYGTKIRAVIPGFKFGDFDFIPVANKIYGYNVSSWSDITPHIHWAYGHSSFELDEKNEFTVYLDIDNSSAIQQYKGQTISLNIEFAYYISQYEYETIIIKAIQLKLPEEL